METEYGYEVHSRSIRKGGWHFKWRSDLWGLRKVLEWEKELCCEVCLSFLKMPQQMSTNWVSKSQTRTEMYSLSLSVEDRTPKSRCWQQWFLLRVVRENLSHVSLSQLQWLLAILGISGLVDASFQSPPLSSDGLVLYVSLLFRLL